MPYKLQVGSDHYTGTYRCQGIPFAAFDRSVPPKLFKTIKAAERAVERINDTCRGDHVDQEIEIIEVE